MANESLEKVWMKVLNFIQEHPTEFGNPTIQVYSDEIILEYKLYGKIDSIPTGVEHWHICPDNDCMILTFIWDCNPDTHD